MESHWTGLKYERGSDPVLRKVSRCNHVCHSADKTSYFSPSPAGKSRIIPEDYSAYLGIIATCYKTIMRNSRKKREAQIKEDLSKPTTQDGLQELVEFIHALTAQTVE
jgi:hypothetical protein